MSFTDKEQELYLSVAELIDCGALPRVVKRALWAGSGQNFDCVVCRTPVSRDQIEYEVEDQSARLYRFHVRCHAIWLLALTDGKTAMESFGSASAADKEAAKDDNLP